MLIQPVDNINYADKAKTGPGMFGIFKKKSEKERLQEQYAKLTKQAYDLSHRDRTAADQKTAEADALLKKIELLDKA